MRYAECMRNLNARTDKSVGAEQIRVWNMFMAVLDKTAAVIGTKAMTVKRYYELSSLQINAMQLSDIPQTIELRNDNNRSKGTNF